MTVMRTVEVGHPRLPRTVNGLWLMLAIWAVELTGRGAIVIRQADYKPPAGAKTAWRLLYRARLSGSGREGGG